MTSRPPFEPEFIRFARQLRQKQVDAEQFMWRLLRGRRFCDLKFRRQHPIPPYVLDFYCHDCRLAVELDGGQHNTDDSRRNDRQRSAFLARQGIRVIRLWNNQVFEETEVVLEGIWNAAFDGDATD